MRVTHLGNVAARQNNELRPRPEPAGKIMFSPTLSTLGYEYHEVRRSVSACSFTGIRDSVAGAASWPTRTATFP